MGRTIRDFQVTVPPETIFQEIQQYLTAEGYTFTQFQNENLFKKGNGILMGPTFIKVSWMNYSMRLEAWMKMAILPFVFVGENDLESFVGAAVKGPLKDRFAHIEDIIRKYSVNPAGAYGQQPYGQQAWQGQQNQAAQQGWQAQQNQAAQQPVICRACGAANTSGLGFCSNCGARL